MSAIKYFKRESIISHQTVILQLLKFPTGQSNIHFQSGSLYRRVMYDDHNICIPCQLVKNGSEVIHLHLESAKFFTDGTSAGVFEGFDEF